jgi:hypothetical protein
VKQLLIVLFIFASPVVAHAHGVNQHVCHKHGAYGYLPSLVCSRRIAVSIAKLPELVRSDDRPRPPWSIEKEAAYCCIAATIFASKKLKQQRSL